MFYKKIRYIIFFISVVFFLSSCVSNELTVEKLISVPKLTDELNQIKEVIFSESGKNITFKYPKSGDNKFPFIFCDIDGDKEDEVVVFYFDNNINNLKFSVLDKDSGVWKSVFSTISRGKDIDKVFISDLLEVKNNQLIISWYMNDDRSDIYLEIYNYQNETLEVIYNQAFFSDVFMFDIDNDQKDELVVVDRNLKMSPNISIIGLNNISNELEKVFYTRLVPGLAGYKKAKIGYIFKNKKALFLDTFVTDNLLEFDGDQSLYTEVIVFKDNNLTNLSYNKSNSKQENEALMKQTLRSQKVLCRDIDHDMIIELPREVSYRDKIKGKKSKTMSLIAWQKYIENKLVVTSWSIENTDDKYSFIIPNDWIVKENRDAISEEKLLTIDPRVIAVCDTNGRSVTFQTNEKEPKKIMEIRASDILNNPLEGYLELMRNNKTVYYVKLYLDSNIDEDKVSYEWVKENFFLTYDN